MAEDHQAQKKKIQIIFVVIFLSLIQSCSRERPESAKVTLASSDVIALGGAVEKYRNKKDSYPEANSFMDLLKKEGYIKRLVKDPWGNDYVLDIQGDSFDLYSLGKDGKKGGERYARDVYYSILMMKFVKFVSEDMKQIVIAIEKYKKEIGSYPKTDTFMLTLLEKGYIKDILKDPWGNAYMLEMYNDRFELYSLGRDAKRGGSGSSKDIHYTNWTTSKL
ncbi:type II secretion system protein GspG [Spartinivicinus poritis]|uniref:Type II secretion system protein GspG n=1 Tax=Spartinivicinus poritis TaxID=2994640 RepID=A0ABT5UGR4_9GAMM|nr:type II secretion system protein GspG [Spartinivicinus sp. A2-2]MDE1465574.1 type II secretion system protein GspG [Spartinivicinus sp. A2-2]